MRQASCPRRAYPGAPLLCKPLTRPGVIGPYPADRLEPNIPWCRPGLPVDLRPQLLDDLVWHPGSVHQRAQQAHEAPLDVHVDSRSLGVTDELVDCRRPLAELLEPALCPLERRQDLGARLFVKVMLDQVVVLVPVQALVSCY